MLQFEEVLTVEEEQYIKETVSFYVNILNRCEIINGLFTNEINEYYNVRFSYPGIKINYKDGVYSFTYLYKAGMPAPKSLLVFNTLLDDVCCIGTCFHKISGWADCVFQEKELKTRFKNIINKLAMTN